MACRGYPKINNSSNCDGATESASPKRQFEILRNFSEDSFEKTETGIVSEAPAELRPQSCAPAMLSYPPS